MKFALKPKYFLLLFCGIVLQINSVKSQDISADSLFAMFTASGKSCTEFESNQYCVTMNAEASIDPANPNVTFFWEFKEDTLYGFEVRKCFDTPGYHKVWLNSKDTIAKNINAHDTMLTFNFPPKPEMNIKGDLINSSTIIFENNLYSYSNKKKIYLWVLGDGSMKIGPEVLHVYRTVGKMEIKLIIFNPMGPSYTIEKCMSKTIEILPNR